MRRATTSALVLCAAVSTGLLAAGCDGSGSPEAAGPDDSIVLADLDQRATAAFMEFGELLVGDGLEPFFGAVNYRGCDSPSPEYNVTALGRYDQPDGRSSTRADAEAIRDLLAEHGWAPTDSDRFTDGIEERSTNWQLHASQGDLYVRATLSNRNQMIAVSVNSYCVPVSDELDEVFMGSGDSRDLDVGATSTTSIPATFEPAPSTTDE